MGLVETDTIAAIATGLTDSGIGIVRISGSSAVEIGDQLFCSPSGKKILKHAESRRLYYGYIENTDEVMAVVMRAPKSFTGEDTVEIQCHGGVLVMTKILEEALRAGARLAEPGEFSRRAFLNGRMDLSRAEAVMDVIHSQNEYALKSSFHQLKGALSEKVRDLRARILYEMAYIESALDDPEHISLEGYRESFLDKMRRLLNELEDLLQTADNGKLIKEGIDTVIVGKPNAGKSSLLNLLVGEERAIVTEIAGTTRDALRETVRVGGISLNVTDTAGIRSTEDAVEKIGVQRAKEYALRSDLILYMVDSSVEPDENDREIIKFIRGKKVIVLLNKSDLDTVVEREKMEILLEENFPVVRISAKRGDGLSELEKAVKDMFFHGEIMSSGEIVITNLRHREALEEVRDSLLLVIRSAEDEMPEDFYSIDLMNAYASLGKIIGEQVDDDLVEEIFSRFCMGK